MPAFFLALIAAALASLAGREAVRVARLSAALGSAPALLVAVWLASAASSAAAGWAGAELARQLAPQAKSMLVALALLFAAGELAFLRAPRAPSEPTRSFAAILTVLLAAQLTDAVRLLVVALAAATGGPWLAGAGGALASGAVLTAAWAARGDWERRLPLAAVRSTVAAVLVIAAIIVGLTARGVFG